MSELTPESTLEEMFAAAAAPEGQTGVRLFEFGPERAAFVFQGPEANLIALNFIQYAEALFEALEAAGAPASERIITDVRTG